MSEKGKIVKQGYLDVKYPPRCPERKRWKAWHCHWLTAIISEQDDTQGNTISLEVSEKKPEQTAVVIWKTKINKLSRLFRCHSGSRSFRTFGIVQNAENAEKEMKSLKVLIYLAAQSEKEAQLWMNTLRNAILPHPSPEAYIEKGEWLTTHSVSLVDDEYSFRQGLLGAYGYFLIRGDSISIVYPHFGHAMSQWALSTVHECKLIRVDQDSATSGVLSIVFKKRLSSRKEQKQNQPNLCFYSPTARIAVEELNKILKKSAIQQKEKTSPALSIKHEASLERKCNSFSRNEGTNSTTKPNSELHNINSTSLTRNNFEESSQFSSKLEALSRVSSNILNSSISSTFQASNSSYDSSSDESDYYPPLSLLQSDFYESYPVPSQSLATESNIPCTADRVRLWDTTNSAEDNVSDYLYEPISSTAVMNPDMMRRASKFSMESHIYADMTIPALHRCPSIGAETLYEELPELMDEYNDCDQKQDQYVPPLPPPRSIARRPTTLRLEQLSENLQSVLNHLEQTTTVIPNRYTLEKKSPISWANPIKGVKKILSKDKTSKSRQPSPTKECTIAKENALNLKRVESEPTFQRNISFSMPDRCFCPTDCQQHLKPETELPLPFLPENLDLPQMNSSLTQTGNLQSERDEIPSHLLQFNDLNSKHCCVHLLKGIKNENGEEQNEFSCTCINQTISPLASFKSEYSFGRRQSKSLSADIEKHFRNLHAEKSLKLGPINIPKPPLFVSDGQDSPHLYCYMGSSSFSQKFTYFDNETGILKIQAPVTVPEDDTEYVDMTTPDHEFY